VPFIFATEKSAFACEPVKKQRLLEKQAGSQQLTPLQVNQAESMHRIGLTVPVFELAEGLDCSFCMSECVLEDAPVHFGPVIIIRECECLRQFAPQPERANFLQRLASGQRHRIADKQQQWTGIESASDQMLIWIRK
jgi:hypothetical protein